VTSSTVDQQCCSIVRDWVYGGVDLNERMQYTSFKYRGGRR
jgi:hypothetical protein